jgi:hypothetical protein
MGNRQDIFWRESAEQMQPSATRCCIDSSKRGAVKAAPLLDFGARQV